MTVAICPRCDQGLIDLVRFGRRGTVAKICQECDAVWPGREIPRRATFLDWHVLLAVLGEPELDLSYEVLKTAVMQESSEDVVPVVDCLRCRRGHLEPMVIDGGTLTVQRCLECDAAWPAEGPQRFDIAVQYGTLLEFLRHD